jgi:[acyl-carrier-protein] S-malonyltransferase
MQPAAQVLRERLESVELSSPQIALINNIDVAVEVDADRIRDALYRQAFGPVRWVECVQALEARGVETVVECGPGKVLTGLVKRICPNLTGVPLYDPASLAAVKELLV